MYYQKYKNSGSDKNPLGYKYLRTWQQANEIFELTEKYVATLPYKHPKTNQRLSDLADHMIRSGRSEVRNIEEGYRRTTTNQYIDFLGFSAGSNEELLGDLEYCIKSNLGDLDIAQKAAWLCRGEGKMLANQIKSLHQKMLDEKNISQNELARRAILSSQEERKRQDEWLEEYIKNNVKDKGNKGR